MAGLARLLATADDRAVFLAPLEQGRHAALVGRLSAPEGSDRGLFKWIVLAWFSAELGCQT